MPGTWFTAPTAKAGNQYMGAAEDALRVADIQGLFDYRLEKMIGWVNQGALSDVSTETTMLQVSIPGGTLGSGNGFFRLEVWWTWTNTTGGSRELTRRLKYGATTIATIASTEGSGYTNNTYKDEFILAPTGSASAQIGMGLGLGRTQDTEVTATAATEASGGDLNLTLTWQWTAAAVGESAQIRAAMLVWVPTP